MRAVFLKFGSYSPKRSLVKNAEGGFVTFLNPRSMIYWSFLMTLWIISCKSEKPKRKVVDCNKTPNVASCNQRSVDTPTYPTDTDAERLRRQDELRRREEAERQRQSQFTGDLGIKFSYERMRSSNSSPLSSVFQANQNQGRSYLANFIFGGEGVRNFIATYEEEVGSFQSITGGLSPQGIRMKISFETQNENSYTESCSGSVMLDASTYLSSDAMNGNHQNLPGSISCVRVEGYDPDSSYGESYR